MALLKPPDYSFKNEVPLSSVMDMIANKNVRQSQLDTQDQNRRQQQFEDVRQVVSDASNTVQQMVQASITRQHANAVRVLGGLLARQDESTMAPGAVVGPQPEGAGQFGPQPANVLNQPAPVRFGDTPQYKTQLETQLFNAFPQEASKQQLEQIYSEKTLNSQSKNWSQGKPYLVDGTPRIISMHSQSGAIRDASTLENLNGHKIEPYTPPSSYGNVREELGVQQNLTDMVKQVKAELTTSPSAKVVVAADNFTNQVDRVLKGEVTPDKTTMAALMTELDRALASGVSSERRMEELTPKTFQGKFADFETYMTNNPTSRDTIQFLRNLNVEAKAAGDQRRASVEQLIRPILAQAKLAQRKDPQGFKQTVESMGLDSKYAAAGKIKFLPNTYSVFYGEGFSPTGAPTASGGIQVDQNALDAEIARRGLK